MLRTLAQFQPGAPRGQGPWATATRWPDVPLPPSSGARVHMPHRRRPPLQLKHACVLHALRTQAPKVKRFCCSNLTSRPGPARLQLLSPGLHPLVLPSRLCLVVSSYRQLPPLPGPCGAPLPTPTPAAPTPRPVRNAPPAAPSASTLPPPLPPTPHLPPHVPHPPPAAPCALPPRSASAAAWPPRRRAAAWPRPSPRR